MLERLMQKTWLSLDYRNVVLCFLKKKSTCNAKDPGSIPGLGRSPGEGIGYPLQYSRASLLIQMVKNLTAIWETWVQSLGWENPLKNGKASHSSILAWRIPSTEEPGRLHSMGSKESDTTERLPLSLFFTLYITSINRLHMLSSKLNQE